MERIPQTGGREPRRDGAADETGPAIDILLSTCNGEAFAEAFIDSLGRQTCRAFRLIVRDDGSEDATAEIVRAAVARSGISARFVPSSGAKLGVVQSYGALLGGSSARYVMFADQDDVWHDDKIAEMLRAMRAAEARHGRETPLLLHSDMRVCDAAGEPMADSFVRYQRISPERNSIPALMIQNVVTGCATLINQALKKRLRLPFPREAVCHDWYLALLASAVGRIVFLDRASVDYRIHGKNAFGATEYAPRSWWISLRRGRGELHRRLVLTQRQAGAFLRQYGDVLADADRRALGAWAAFETLSPPKRIAACLAYGFGKNTLLRTLEMLWAL